MYSSTNQPCDARCPAVALVYVERDGFDLAFCGHCFDDRVVALFAEGWAVRDDTRPVLRIAEAQRR